MSPPTVTKLPQELIHTIIDHTTSDESGIPSTQMSQRLIRRAVGTCSLISKAWLPRGRQYLFNNISLYTGERNKERTLRFVELLGSPLGTIAPHVRHLELYNGNDKKTIWLNQAALLQLAVLSAVECLHIDQGQFELLSVGDAMTTSFFSSFSMLKRLHLAFCTFASDHQLSLALSAIPQMEHLRLYVVQQKPKPSNILSLFWDRLTYPAQISSPISFRPMSNHLRFLEINECNFMPITRWLQSCGNIPTLDTLQLTLQNKTDMLACSELMRAIGSSLTNLTISCITTTNALAWPAADSTIYAVDLGQNDRLRIIRVVRVTAMGDQQPFRYPGTCILAQITSSCIEEVVLDVGLTSGGIWLRDLDWDTMDRLFTRPNFSHLKKVLVSVWAYTLCSRGPELRADMLRWLAQRLPACHARGIIDVKF